MQAGAVPGSSFLPALCPRCRDIVTAADGRDDGGWRCTTCETPSRPLPGAVLEPGRELPPELVGLDCPACSSQPLRAYESGLWD